MTLKESKKILKKEGFILSLASKVINQTGAIREFEKPEVCEAIKVANANRWTIGLSPIEWDKREARLKKEYEKNTKASGPGEEQPKEKKGIIYPTTSPKADFYYKHVLNEGNPALKEAASQFNDALLAEQAKQIAEQNKEITRLLSLVEKKENSISRLYYEKSVLEKENEELKKGEIPAKYFDKALVDEQAEKIKKLEHEKLDILEMASSCKQTVAERAKKIARLKKIIRKKNMKIEEFRKESSIHLRGKIKMFVENRDLEGKLKDKDAVLSDVAEELRLSKIREKNLTEVCQKYMKENEKLKKELADKVVDKIDAQALKSAESALAYKDEVIETLDKELAEAKHELSSLKRPFRPDSTEAVVLFANAYAKAERKHLPCTGWRNDGKEVSATYILENGKKSKIALDFTGDEIIFSRTDPDKPRKDSLYSYKDKQLAEKDKVIADLGNGLAATKKELEEANYRIKAIRNGSKQYCEYGIAAEKMIQKMADIIVYDRPVFSKDFEQYRLWANGYRFNPQLPELSEEEEKKLSPFRDDSVGAVTNQKDCSPVKDNHPTEDNPEEVEVDEILERVRKALEEGCTVSIDYEI